MAMTDEDLFGLPFLPEFLQGRLQQVTEMTDEELFQEMMEQFGMMEEEESPAQSVEEWKDPLDAQCDCLPAARY